MKKLIILFTILVAFGLNVDNSFAADESCSSGTVSVIVTEDIPGAKCNPTNNTTGGIKTYKCCVAKGTAGITNMLGDILKWFTYIVALAGVLFIVINGVMYSMGGIEESMKTEAKKRIIGTIIGLVLLFVGGYVLKIIAPWVYS